MSLLDRCLPTVALALGALAPAALADTIFLVDGTKLEDVSVQEAQVTNVAYRVRNDRKEVPSERVLRIEFSRKPRAVEEAETLASEGDTALAVLRLYEYVDASTSTNPERQFPWGPAYAAAKRVELLQGVNDFGGTVEAADLLLTKFPESQFAPAGYLAKAEAQTLLGEPAQAAATLGRLVELAGGTGVSARWRLAAQVELAAIDVDTSGNARIDRLEALAKEAGSQFPTVRDRAFVAQGEVYLELADQDPSAAADHVTAARAAFEDAYASEAAEDATRAGALVGLGDCLYRGAATRGDVEGLRRALLDHYLKVVVLYPEQPRYASKATFYAGLCFVQIADATQDAEAKERGRRLMRTVERRYSGSVWADEARRYR
jgi:hypothetical protein